MTRTRSLQLILSIALIVVSGIPLSAADLKVEFLAETAIAGDLEVDGTLVGGLSGLTYDPVCSLYHAISDDRGSIGPIRFYTFRLTHADPVEVEILSATVLRRPSGDLFERGDLDPEALALHPDGSLYLASEGVRHREVDPMVARFSLDGTCRGQIELPGHFLPDSLLGPQNQDMC